MVQILFFFCLSVSIGLGLRLLCFVPPSSFAVISIVSPPDIPVFLQRCVVRKYFSSGHKLLVVRWDSRLCFDFSFHDFCGLFRTDLGCDRPAFPCFHVYCLFVLAVNEIVVLDYRGIRARSLDELRIVELKRWSCMLLPRRSKSVFMVFTHRFLLNAMNDLPPHHTKKPGNKGSDLSFRIDPEVEI